MKEQKQVQEDISRMSSKAMAKVQDDIRSLKKQLSLSTSGLQRNALAIDKLKMETAQVRTHWISHIDTPQHTHTHAHTATQLRWITHTHRIFEPSYLSFSDSF